MQIPFFIVDTFSSQPFSGNPTGICYTEHELGNDVMQQIAKELHLPVTAFFNKDAIIHDSYRLRYFTCFSEIPVCGHATLGAAAIVFDVNSLLKTNFITQGGMLLEAISTNGLIQIKYPAFEIFQNKVSAEMLYSLGIDTYKSAGYCSELEALFIELANPETLRNASPDFQKLVASSDTVKEVVLTCLSDKNAYDYLLRSFCPWIGIKEDPVTGSVHSVLAGYWGSRLKKNSLVAYQASERGGEIHIFVAGDGVLIGGATRLVLKGELSV
jgi:PhzF family phenazine biosynthesis protein